LKNRRLKKEKSRIKHSCRMQIKKWKGWADKFFLVIVIQRTIIKISINSVYGKIGGYNDTRNWNIDLINELNEENTTWLTKQKESEKEILDY
jgi:hypothetical protein